MLKYKYFFLPYDKPEIGAIGGWLESKAAQGYKLTDITFGQIFKFEKTSTSKISYCIHPRMDDAHCDMPGWKYIGTLSRNFDILIAVGDNNDTVESNTNPMHIEAALEKEISSDKVKGILLFFIAVAMPVFGIKLSMDLGGFTSFLIDYGLLFVGLLVVFICSMVSGLLYIDAYINRKKRINLLMERKEQQVIKTHRLLKVMCVFIVCFGAWMICLHLIMPNKIYSIPLDEYTAEVSLPLMDQISPKEWSAAESAHEKDGSNKIIYGFVTEENSFVAPTLLYIEQYGEIVEDETDSYERLFEYHVNYYEMRNEGLSVRYEDELCRKLNSGKMTTIHVIGFDSATYFLYRKTEKIVLRSGNIVITATYYGSGSLLDSVHQFSSTTHLERNLK